MVVGVELDAVSCLVLGFKDGGPESVCETDMLDSDTAGKTAKVSYISTQIFSL